VFEEANQLRPEGERVLRRFALFVVCQDVRFDSHTICPVYSI
jgi:hypothetical protein